MTITLPMVIGNNSFYWPATATPVLASTICTQYSVLSVARYDDVAGWHGYFCIVPGVGDFLCEPGMYVNIYAEAPFNLVLEESPAPVPDLLLPIVFAIAVIGGLVVVYLVVKKKK